MTVRAKLNFAVAALILVFLTSAGFALSAVSKNAERTQLYSRMRDLGRLTSDIRTDIYHQLAFADGGSSPRKEPTAIGWPEYVYDDIDVQIHLAETDRERENWGRLRAAIGAINQQLEQGISNPQEPLRDAEHFLRELRSRYDLLESQAIAAAASTAFRAQVAISLAGILTVVLFLVYLIIVRDWLIHPIRVLKQSADTIGEGRLDYRVPLHGRDELAELARRIDHMAARLSEHQQALLESRELSAIGELCANVAHGLRNPLASLRVSAQLAGRRAGDAEETRIALLEIIRQVDRLNERITRLFEFSRFERPQLNETTFSMIARSGLIDLTDLPGKRGIELRVEDNTGDTVWLLDTEAIAGVVSELVLNAVHHSEPGGWVLIRGSRESGLGSSVQNLVIRVIDCGKGMAPATVEKAFDLFFTARENGTGMGLAMARRAIERLGGTITLESEPDRGTTVTTVLPSRFVSRTHVDGSSAAASASESSHDSTSLVKTQSRDPAAGSR